MSLQAESPRQTDLSVDLGDKMRGSPLTETTRTRATSVDEAEEALNGCSAVSAGDRSTLTGSFTGSTSSTSDVADGLEDLEDLGEEDRAKLLDFCAGMRLESDDSGAESGPQKAKRTKAQRAKAQQRTKAERRAAPCLKHQVELDMQGVVGRADELVKQWRAVAKPKPKEEPKPAPPPVTTAYAAPTKGKGKGLARSPKGKGKGSSMAQNEIAALASRAQHLLPANAGYGGQPMSSMAVYALAFTPGAYDVSEYGHYATPFPPVYQFPTQPGAA